MKTPQILSWMLGRKSLFKVSLPLGLQPDPRLLPFLGRSLRFIYELIHCGNLDWVYGGEYGELYKLIAVVVKAWLAVGLKPHFVFDGEQTLDFCCPKLADFFFPIQVLSLPSSSELSYHG